MDQDHVAAPPDIPPGQGGQDAVDPGGAGGPQLQQQGGQVAGGQVLGDPGPGGQLAGPGVPQELD